MTDAFAIQTEKLTKIYGSGNTEVVAMRDASITVRRGEVAALLGPSGAGKSTFLTSVGLITPLTSGRVAIGGKLILDGPIPAQPPSVPPQAHRLRVPKVESDPVLDGVRKCPDRPPTQRPRPPRRPPPSDQPARLPRRRRARAQPAVDALRRPAAARGRRPCAGQPAQRAPGRRADRGGSTAIAGGR